MPRGLRTSVPASDSPRRIRTKARLADLPIPLTPITYGKMLSQLESPRSMPTAPTAVGDKISGLEQKGVSDVSASRVRIPHLPHHRLSPGTGPGSGAGPASGPSRGRPPHAPSGANSRSAYRRLRHRHRVAGRRQPLPPRARKLHSRSHPLAGAGDDRPGGLATRNNL